MPDAAFALRASFFSAALWWVAFSVPLFRNVPEPPAVHGPREGSGGAVRAGFKRLAHTAREVRRFRQLWLFLVAFWLYNDGIGTIIKMATAFGHEIGIAFPHLILALVITQFVGIPCSLAFGALAPLVGTKRLILFGIAVYAVISVAGSFMRTAAHFYILAFVVGLVQGGTQALSRSLFGAMIPKTQAAEFFGFFGTSSRIAGITGPVLFGLVTHVTGSSRLSVLALLSLFVGGGLLLMRVDEEEAMRAARKEDEEVSGRQAPRR